MFNETEHEATLKVVQEERKGRPVPLQLWHLEIQKENKN